ncbi:MAG: TRAP transporter fused permease subunit [Rhodospirillales bacterium]|jgi:TRAP transporter 4TM/12TM fusion protein|nr:TRAP transporter fused permease subunit [Rhodospirillales bacterium]
MSRLLASGVVFALAATSVVFHLYLIFSGLLPNLVTRPLHLALALPWVFVIGVDGGRARRWTGYVFCAVGVAGSLWIAWNRDILVDQYGSLEGPFQYGLAIALIVVVLEMARRRIKAALPIVAVLALAYGLLGHLIPGQFGHPGMPLDSFFGTLVVAGGGLWGELTGISVNVVAVFVILGAFVSASEGGPGFMLLATRLAGRMRAGPAKVAVLSSAMFGSISGSASANVASTGAVTLPAMKRLGYPPAFAAAVEAVASSGGQIMPPLMGAGAFLMVELLRITYVDVMTAAILPSILFFWATWAGVDHFAKRHGLRGMAPDEMPSWDDVMRTAPFFLLPFGVLLAILFFTGYTPQYAAAVATGISMLLLAVDRTGCVSLGLWWRELQTAVVDAARQIATVAAIIICAGLVIGVLNMTGLGVKVTSVIIALSGGTLWMALVLTAIACLILGMEVPTTAAYVICVSVAGPALQTLGLPALHAHLFVFWYALLSTITPPVCGTVFIAAAMADAPWVAVANRAMRLGLGLYVVPLAFIVNPALIHPELSLPLALLAMLKVGAGVWLMSGAVAGRGRQAWTAPLSFALGAAAIFLGGVG